MNNFSVVLLYIGALIFQLIWVCMINNEGIKHDIATFIVVIMVSAMLVKAVNDPISLILTYTTYIALIEIHTIFMATMQMVPLYQPLYLVFFFIYLLDR